MSSSGLILVSRSLKLPDEKKLAIKNDIIESPNKVFPSGSPVRFTGGLILGTATNLLNKNDIEFDNHLLEICRKYFQSAYVLFLKELD